MKVFDEYLGIISGRLLYHDGTVNFCNDFWKRCWYSLIIVEVFDKSNLLLHIVNSVRSCEWFVNDITSWHCWTNSSNILKSWFDFGKDFKSTQKYILYKMKMLNGISIDR